ncbi:ABC-2 type transport system ATP-binding protein [Pedobacter cryoconitis]|uniref:ABC-2 type transport system ATP-binding protein n=1 Tax=Pedobacter cryoconitis TaxID=188932 RepID=A0A7W8ZJU8_9SPHI|nr:ATP-binding cassette domain-containing protein [Pedobacter cryoconitis]MBB5635389.1 ABC-2 type transport system ATP-binding protein [Pedobacter cryoconitis]
MINTAIQTHELTYYFGKQKIVDNLSLKIEKGSIYGFLGHNGAGKTTTIKILLNLLKSPEDTVFIFGKEINKHRIEILKKIGALVEQPALYAHLSGKENLLNRCILLNIQKNRALAQLELVGLKDAADKKTSEYSLGMKQRLGIAMALLANPELLLLDEPTNGLDPGGIIEIRNLIIELATKHQKTILISSHLLSEIEKIATHVGIINKGKLLFQGTINELHQLSNPTIEIEVSQPERAVSFLIQQGFKIQIQTETRIILDYTSPEETGEINTLLIQNGFTVFSLFQVRKNLENLFLDITRNN